jgi:hypothetical protein
MAKKYSEYNRNAIGRVAWDVLLGWKEYCTVFADFSSVLVI